MSSAFRRWKLRAESGETAVQAVITKEQAKQITRGRTPLVPVEYETAIGALQACVTLDESKYWSDKADALAAWAKIYRSDDASRKAKMLKLHAYRRMGELARELGKQSGGALPVLQDAGLRGYQARAAMTASRLPVREFNSLVNSEKPPSPSSLRLYAEGRESSDSWMTLSGRMQGSNNSFTGFRAFVRRHDAKELAHGLTKDEAAIVREGIEEITDWLDEFEQHLPRR